MTKTAPTTPAAPTAPLSAGALLTAAAVALAATLWAYWPGLTAMAGRWSRDAEYSHGYLVPVFALFLLWARRGRLDRARLGPSWWGLSLLLLGVGMRLVAARYYLDAVDDLSLVPVVAGLVVLLGGGHALQWSWPAVLFLVFMMPLPHSLEIALQYPLQRIGTLCSTYVMQTAGLPALAEGNVILVEEVKIGVVEACSGLRMLMIFFALSTAVAVLSERPLWERLVLFASAVPIAIFANVTRITATGLLHATGNSHLADLVFHDLAGWLMMPLALGLLWIESWILAHLLIVEEKRPMAVGLDKVAAGPSLAAAAPREPLPVNR